MVLTMENRNLSLNDSEIMDMFHEIHDKNPCNICSNEEPSISTCEVCENTPMKDVERGYLPVSNMYSDIMKNIYLGAPFEKAIPYIYQLTQVLKVMKMERIEKPYHKTLVGWLQPLAEANTLIDAFKVYDEFKPKKMSSGSIMDLMKQFRKMVDSEVDEHDCDECNAESCENRDENS